MKHTPIRSLIATLPLLAAFGVAACGGNATAKYLEGGVTPDQALVAAAAQGDKEAAHKRDEVAAQLDAKDLAAAKQAVKTWAALPQPVAATTVPQPAGGWNEAAPASHEAPNPASWRSAPLRSRPSRCQ